MPLLHLITIFVYMFQPNVHVIFRKIILRQKIEEVLKKPHRKVLEITIAYVCLLHFLTAFWPGVYAPKYQFFGVPGSWK